MDAYISYLSQVENDKGTIKVRHELVSTTNNILNGQYVPGRNETNKFEPYDVIMGAYHQRGHWNLLIVEPQLQRIIFLNPLGETNLQERMVLSNWRKYIRQLEMLYPEYGQINWTLHIPDHSKQQDGSSCGIYCLMFAEKHLKGSSLEGITQAEANWERKKVANTLMMFEGTSDSIFSPDISPVESFSACEVEVQPESCLSVHNDTSDTITCTPATAISLPRYTSTPYSKKNPSRTSHVITQEMLARKQYDVLTVQEEKFKLEVEKIKLENEKLKLEIRRLNQWEIQENDALLTLDALNV